MLISNKIIMIPENLRSKYNLPTNVINAAHIQELIKYQDNLRFKLAPKSCQEDLIPTHFRTMRVSTSTHVVSHDVSSGLKFLTDELKQPEFKTTAWFIDQIEEWFTIMTSRHPTVAVSKNLRLLLGLSIKLKSGLLL
ncbi:hypothetical protein QE152_g35946 [Popillia japonica]|uniref:Transposable element P transposase-like GTP-binding insertion domain-containing protein n=1 Tax=Popillia japonica TaxID=7064 RepID=A0AAW1IER2_POPJA